MGAVSNAINIVFIVFGLVIGWVSTAGSKTQLIRLVDIMLYGPLLIYAGSTIDTDAPIKTVILRYILYIIGASTITYNLKNLIADGTSPFVGFNI